MHSFDNAFANYSNEKSIKKLQKHSSFDEAFTEYLQQESSPEPAPPRPFGALMRDSTIASLMKGNEEDVAQHQDALAREAILNAQAEKVAREKKYPAHLVKKLTRAKENVDAATVGLQAKRQQKREEDVRDVKEEEQKARQEAKEQRSKEAAVNFAKDVQSFNIYSESDFETPAKKRRHSEPEPPVTEDSDEDDPDGEPLSRQDKQPITKRRAYKRKQEAKQGLPISPENQFERHGTYIRYKEYYKRYNQEMPKDFVPVGGFYVAKNARKK